MVLAILDSMEDSSSVLKMASLLSTSASVWESWVASVGVVLVDSPATEVSDVEVVLLGFERVLEKDLGLS